MLALAAAGTISMATLEVIKALTPIRENYQRRWFRKWIAFHASRASSSIAFRCQVSTPRRLCDAVHTPVEQSDSDLENRRSDSAETVTAIRAVGVEEIRSGAQNQLVELATGGDSSE